MRFKLGRQQVFACAAHAPTKAASDEQRGIWWHELDEVWRVGLQKGDIRYLVSMPTLRLAARVLILLAVGLRTTSVATVP